jgi:putative heme-binding domain-containing protein
LSAARAPDEQKVEFMASTDDWFRPVNFANGPDGTLYVVDMYREVIEESASIPDGIKKFLDFTSGDDRGRIYRIVPERFQRRKPVQLSKATTAELVALLEHPNGWHRETAARLLYERQDKLAVGPLERLLMRSDFPLARLRALSALDGLGALSADLLVKAMNDADPFVRQSAVRLSESLLHQESPASPALLAKVLSLARDPSALVRYQLAFTLGEMPAADRINALTEILRQDAESSWTRIALLNSLTQGRGQAFTAITENAPLTASKGGQEFLRQLVMLIGAANELDEVRNVFDHLTLAATPSAALIGALGEGLRSAGSTLASLDQQNRLQRVFARAREIAGNPAADAADRVQSIELLGLTSFQSVGAFLGSFLDPAQPQAIQSAAIGVLARFKEPEVAHVLLKSWPGFTPRLRSEGLAILLARPERAQALLEAIKGGGVKTSELNPGGIQFLRNHKDSSVRELAAEVLPNSSSRPRQEVVATFKESLSLPGDAEDGRRIYLQRCVSCHRAENQGFQLGPDLVAAKAGGKEKLIDSILDPSREIDPAYRFYLVETKEGESLFGVIASETATSITIRQPFGKENVVFRSHLKRVEAQPQSIMPEGLESGLTQQQLADLIEFIEKLK